MIKAKGIMGRLTNVWAQLSIQDKSNVINQLKVGMTNDNALLVMRHLQINLNNITTSKP